MHQKLRYLVLGTGVGRAIAADLLKRPDTQRVTVGDMDYGKAEKAVFSICPDYARTERCMPTFFHLGALPNHDIRKSFRNFSAVVSAIPATHSVRLASLALEAGIPFCDLGGDYAVSTRLRHELGSAATKDAQLPIVHDCGFMPGTGNMEARRIMEQHGGADTIRILTCGLPQYPLPEAAYHQKTYSVGGQLTILEDARIVRNGSLVTSPAFAGMRNIRVPALERFAFGGRVQSCITSCSGTAAEYFRKCGVQNFWEETQRWSWAALRELIESYLPAERTAHLERVLPATDAEHPDLIWMRVEVGGQTHEVLDTFDRRTGLSAMARMTGFSAAAMAHALAQGRIPPGVQAPEELPLDIITDCLRETYASLRA